MKLLLNAHCATAVQSASRKISLAILITVAPVGALACSFGNLEHVRVGSTFQDILNAVQHGCGGSVTIERYCIGSCEESLHRYGPAFRVCTGQIRAGTPRCAIVSNGKIISIKRQTEF